MNRQSTQISANRIPYLRTPFRRAHGLSHFVPLAFQSRPAAAAALELLKLGSKSKATPKRLRQQLASVSERERRVAAPKARLCGLCFSACVQKQGKTVVLMRKEIND